LKTLSTILVITLIALEAFALGSDDSLQTKLILEPLTGVGRPSDEELASISGRRVRDYEAFTVVSIPESRAGGINETAVAKRFRVELAPHWDVVSLPQMDIDVRRAPSKVTESSPGPGRGLYVVQFEGPPWKESLEAIETAGLIVTRTFASHAFLVFGEKRVVSEFGNRPDVQWTSYYHQEFRALPEERAIPDSAMWMIVLPDVPESTLLTQSLMAANSESVSVTREHRTLVVGCQLDAATARELRTDPLTIVLEQSFPFLDSGERQSIAVSPNTTPKTYRAWLSQKGLSDTSAYAVAIADSGFWAGIPNTTMHQDFALKRIDYHDFMANAGNYCQDNIGHGTAVAGMAVGDPQTSGTNLYDTGAGYWYGLGVAASASLIAIRTADLPSAPASWPVASYIDKARNGDPANGKTLRAAAMNLSKNVYDSAASGAYSIRDRELDQAVVDFNLPVTVAVGNVYPVGFAGYPYSTIATLSPAVAKNAISVGASETNWPDHKVVCPTNSPTPAPWTNRALSERNVAYFSRRGTADGRVKPDVVAPGSVVTSARRVNTTPWCGTFGTGGTTSYLFQSGTSFAAPQASAVIVLANKYWGRAPETPLSAALAKAILVASAESVWDSVSPGTDPHRNGYEQQAAVHPRGRAGSGQGWGRLDAEPFADGKVRAFEETRDPRAWHRALFSSGETRNTVMQPMDPSKPITVVIAWTDDPGSEGSGRQLRNDIDLRIKTSECGAGFSYLGNRWTSETGTAAELSANLCGIGGVPGDVKNNVEMIRFSTTGTFEINIRATSIVRTTGLPFAVAVWNAY
jgi:hypothetical protein